jgi:hypothetical protein
VRLRLGSGFVRIELEDKHIDLATDEAVKVYGRFIPLLRFKKIQLVDADEPSTDNPTGRAYPLDSDITGIYKMDFVFRQTSLAVVEDIFHRRYYEPIHDMDSYARYLHYIDMLKRVLSIEPDWSFDRTDPHNPKVWIWAPRQAQTILACAVCYVKRGLHQIQPLHEDWIERYSLMQCKETLARPRSKWQNIPAPSGGQQLDGQMLLSESKEEKAELMAEIKSWQTTLPPIWG